MSFSNLPFEILLCIINTLGLGDRNALVRTDHLLYSQLNEHLYKDHIKRTGGIGLLWASRYGRKEAVVKLLAQGADPNLYTKLLREADDSRRYAFQNGSYYTASFPAYIMISSSTSTECKCIVPMPEAYGKLEILWTGLYDKYDTALSEAVKHHQNDIAEILLARDDVDIGFWNSEHKTALHLAAERGNSRLVEDLLFKCANNLSTATDGKPSPLSLAVYNHHPHIVHLLLAGSTSFSEPLRTITIGEDYGGEMMELLLDGVVRGTLRIIEPTRSIGYIVRNRSPMAMKVLLAHPDLDLNTNYHSDHPALVCAVLEGSPEMARVILETGRADVNACDADGNTPLFYAARRGKRDIVDLLLAQEGVIRYPKNDEGQTPADWALQAGYPIMARLLEPSKKLSRELRDLLQDTW